MSEMDNPLNDLMSFGNVVYSDGEGSVTDEFDDTVFGPEVVYVDLNEEGSVSSPETIEMSGYGDWELLQGFTGQYSYNGPIMHDSEYIGGRLEDHIRENRGYYAAVIVDGDRTDENDESIAVGWAVAFKKEV
ncbi:hypothetical protein SEA_NEDARYA_99 [Gordonia phage Nedarya]|nr:hypothetical protein SEA_NEDARYA_99 [Gordonia phage Nedarya]